MLRTADEVDLAAEDFWLRPEDEREAAFALLRRDRPVAFFEEPEFEMFPKGPGYWSLTKYDDVVFASRHPELFISGKGSNIPTCHRRSTRCSAR